MKNIYQSRRLETSAGLMAQPPGWGEPGADGVFLTGRISKQKKGRWIFRIDSDCPTAVISQQINDEFGMSCPTVSAMRQGKGDKLSLISAGGLVWITDKGGQRRLVLIKRDESAPSDPGLLTPPAGRCDRRVFDTIRGELNEEIAIVRKEIALGRSHHAILGFFLREEERPLIVAEKLRQVEKRHNALLKFGRVEEAALLRLIRGPEDVELIKLEPIKESGLETVMVQVGDSLIEEVDNCYVLLDRKNNTLEVRQAFDVVLQNQEVVFMTDGESYGERCGRDIVCVESVREIRPEQAVPALRYYQERQLKRQPS